jgi:hypothetical protein
VLMASECGYRSGLLAPLLSNRDYVLLMNAA